MAVRWMGLGLGPPCAPHGQATAATVTNKMFTARAGVIFLPRGHSFCLFTFLPSHADDDFTHVVDNVQKAFYRP